MMSKSTVPGEFQGQLQGTIAFMAPEVGCLLILFSLSCLVLMAIHPGAARGQLWSQLRHLESRLSHHRDGDGEAALGGV